MFTLGAGMYKEMTKRDEYFVLVCGPESSGKTTFAEQFRVQCDSRFQASRRTTSTIGLNLVKFNIDGFVLNFWDVGGNKELQSLWDRYIEDCHAIVFVIDSCGDEDNYDTCLQALEKIMSFDQAQKVPLMIVLNKCDLLDAHLPCSPSGSCALDKELPISDDEFSTQCVVLNNENGWTSQDDAEYGMYKAYGWEQPGFVPPTQMGTSNQRFSATTSSVELLTQNGADKKSKNANDKEKVLMSRTKRLQSLRDACQNLCERVHRADMAVFSISALKAVNLERCRKWLSQQLTSSSLSTPASSAVKS